MSGLIFCALHLFHLPRSHLRILSVADRLSRQWPRFHDVIQASAFHHVLVFGFAGEAPGVQFHVSFAAELSVAGVLHVGSVGIAESN